MNINAAEVAAALNNNKLIITNNASEITSSTPLRGSKPGNNSLIVVVCSDKVQLQHKASCYRGHGYSNRLIFPAGGALLLHYNARISRVTGTLLGNASPRLSDTP